MFAATPPLKAKEITVISAFTEAVGHQEGHAKEGVQIDFIDVRNTSIQSDAIRKVFAKLLGEDHEEGMRAYWMNLCMGQEMQHRIEPPSL